MKRGSIFETDGIPRIQEALPLALQHVVAMIVGCHPCHYCGRRSRA